MIKTLITPQERSQIRTVGGAQMSLIRHTGSSGSWTKVKVKIILIKIIILMIIIIIRVIKHGDFNEKQSKVKFDTDD